MAIEVETQDCTALTDADLEEMADLTADQPISYDIGVLSKQREDWVLITRATVGSKLHAYSFCTLERVGGTPAVLVGMASIRRSSRCEAVLRAVVADQLRRAVLAFPDEDVLIGAKLADASGFEAFKPLNNVVPRPGYEPNGEDRAWGRRLEKRFVPEGSYSQREFKVTGEGNVPHVLDFASSKPDKIDPDVVAMFSDDTTRKVSSFETDARVQAVTAACGASASARRSTSRQVAPKPGTGSDGCRSVCARRAHP